MINRILAFSFLLLQPLLSRGFIMCDCDTQECQAAGKKECRADVFCYVSFRPAQAEELKASESTMLGHGAGSQLFIAQHRGCATNAENHLRLCNEQAFNGANGHSVGGGRGIGGGGFRNLNNDVAATSTSKGPKTVVRCCRDSFCNIGQELSFTRAELDGRQFPLNPEISNLEPGLDFPMFQPGGHPSMVDPFGGVPDQAIPASQYPDHRYGEAVAKPKKRAPYANDGPMSQWYPPQPGTAPKPLLPSPYHHEGTATDNLAARSGGSAAAAAASKKDDLKVPRRTQKEATLRGGAAELREDSEQEQEESEDSRGNKLAPVIVLQPLHIAIGVCLIILMLVAVLLHVVVVLHRRHRRLKRELLKQTNKPGTVGGGDYAQNAIWPPLVVNSASMSPQHHGQNIGMQQFQYTTAPLRQPTAHQYPCYVPKKSRSKWSWCPWRSPAEEQSPSHIYEEALPPVQTSDLGQQFAYCRTQESIQSPLTYHGATTTSTSLPSSAPTPPTLPNSPALRLFPQQAAYVPASPDHQQINQQMALKSPGPYGTGRSSLSGGSGNNCPSTAESSLPASNCWNVSTTAANGAAFRQNVLTAYPPPNIDRPSLSGSSDADAFGSPDFENRRANVALPPALVLAAEGNQSQTATVTTASDGAAIGLAVFRSAPRAPESEALVTPYAQLQLSLTFDPYDTPEQVFGAGGSSVAGSSSLDGGYPTHPLYQQTGSNPTTNSSLLHSYCEQGGSGGIDFRA